MQQSTQRDPSQEESQKKKRSYNDSSTTVGDTPRRQRREKYTPAAWYIRGAAADGEVVESTSNRCTALEAQVRGLEAQVQQLQNVIEDIKIQVSKSALGGSGSGHAHNGQPSTNENDTSTASRRQHARVSSSQIKGDSAPTRPQFHGPTSSDFSFSVANSALSRLGIETMNPGSRIQSAVTSRRTSPEPTSRDPGSHSDLDPLLALGLPEVKRALDVYEEELHPVYPFIDVDDVRERAAEMYHELEVACSADGPEGSRICGAGIMVMKMMVATALVVEGAGKSVIGQALLGSVDAALDKSVKGFGIDMKQLQLFTLTSIYHFHCDEDTLAWRTIGIAVRIALEMGLHRKESLLANVPDPEKRNWALRLFYCIYVLDRRWSFGTGLPFALHESDIDPELPNLEGKVPYLESMVSYGKLSSKIWELVAGFNSKAIEAENVNYLDFQVQRWRESLPPSLQLVTSTSASRASSTPGPDHNDYPPQSRQILQVLLYLRANHMRILIHRHHILSSQSIASNRPGAHLVTTIAKDTIRLLVLMRKTSTIYETQQPSYNYFLISALAAIFLAVCHDPAEFSAGCRDEFFSALELLKVLSSQGASAKRLWRSLRGLRSVAPRLGLTPRESEMLDDDGAAHWLGNETSSPLPDKQRTRSRPRPSNTDTAFSYRPLVQTTSGLESVTPAGERVWNVNKVHDENLNGMMDAEFELPDMFYMSNELTNMFEAFGDVQGNVGVDFGGGDVSALFGDLL
ncbi:hypothetical protein ACEPPN_007600 [Leptodophora sp. 'Broadleaf-Isolate-01']